MGIEPPQHLGELCVELYKCLAYLNLVADSYAHYIQTEPPARAETPVLANYVLTDP